MEHITAALAKRDFNLGLLTGFKIDFFQDHISVHFLHKSSALYYLPLVDARTKELRVFKTVDAAVNAIRSVGFVINSMQGF